MGEREADVYVASWCFSSQGVSRQAEEHASSQIRHVDVFQRIGVSRQRAARSIRRKQRVVFHESPSAPKMASIKEPTSFIRSRSSNYDEVTALTLRKGPPMPLPRFERGARSDQCRAEAVAVSAMASGSQHSTIASISPLRPLRGSRRSSAS